MIKKNGSLLELLLMIFMDNIGVYYIDLYKYVFYVEGCLYKIRGFVRDFLGLFGLYLIFVLYDYFRNCFMFR